MLHEIGYLQIQQPAQVFKSTATEHPRHDQRSPNRASEQSAKQSPAVSPRSNAPGPGTEVDKESVGNLRSEIEDEAQLPWHDSAREATRQQNLTTSEHPLSNQASEGRFSNEVERLPEMWRVEIISQDNLKPLSVIEKIQGKIEVWLRSYIVWWPLPEPRKRLGGGYTRLLLNDVR